MTVQTAPGRDAPRTPRPSGPAPARGADHAAPDGGSALLGLVSGALLLLLAWVLVRTTVFTAATA